MVINDIEQIVFLAGAFYTTALNRSTRIVSKISRYKEGQIWGINKTAQTLS